MTNSWLDLLLSEIRWSQEDLARATGLDPATISNIRSGKRGVGVKVAGIIAAATGKTTDEILRRAGVLKDNDEDESDPLIEAGLFALKKLRGDRRAGAVRILQTQLEVQEEAEKNARPEKKSKAT